MKLSLTNNIFTLTYTLYRSDKDELNALLNRSIKLGLYVDDTCCWLLADGDRYLKRTFDGFNYHQFKQQDLDKLNSQQIRLRARTPIDTALLGERTLDLSEPFSKLLLSVLESQKDSGFDENRYQARYDMISNNYDSQENLFGSAHILETYPDPR